MEDFSNNICFAEGRLIAEGYKIYNVPTAILNISHTKLCREFTILDWLT